MIEVSVIIPCRNEEKFIARCLDSIVAQDYRGEMEVLVADGLSEDGTRGIVEKYRKLHPFIRLLDNPRKITPCALNIGIKQSQGKIIVRMDAHSSYPSHFISKGLEVLRDTGADVVGGPVATLPREDTIIAGSVALITSHPFGVGNSRFRTAGREGYVDTVPFGIYRREVFDKVGLFDERLERNQDNEFSSRITGRGGKIYLTPELTAEYYNQPTVTGLLKQALKTGMWNAFTLKVNKAAFRPRHFVPSIFVISLLTGAAFAPFNPWLKKAFFFIVGMYAGGALISSLQIGIRKGIKYVWSLPIIFFLYHFCYGIGTLSGALRLIIGWKGNRADNSY